MDKVTLSMSPYEVFRMGLYFMWNGFIAWFKGVCSLDITVQMVQR